VAGRYYRSPPGTPFYPGYTNLGSRTWHDRNWIVQQALGEDVTAPQVWDAGELPTVLPLVQSAGSADCLSNGDTSADSLPTEDLIDGFSKACFVPAVLTPPPFGYVSDLNSCSLQYAYAVIIGWLYSGNFSAVANFFQQFLGPSTVVSVHPGTTLLPTVATVYTPQYMICIVNGTSNFQQLALEGTYGLQNPQDYGLFGTEPLWYSASDWIHSCLIGDGLAVGQSIMFAGHSYGAAACTVLAARYSLAKQLGAIAVIGYGCPKPGDSRLAAIIENVSTRYISNQQDLVTALPPTYPDCFSILALIGVPALYTWLTWVRAGYPTLLHPDGSEVPFSYPQLDFATIFAIATDVVGSIPYPVITDHMIGTYATNVFARCGVPEWPLTAALYALLV
jgi:hypothetical protein